MQGPADIRRPFLCIGFRNTVQAWAAGPRNRGGAPGPCRAKPLAISRRDPRRSASSVGVDPAHHSRTRPVAILVALGISLAVPGNHDRPPSTHGGGPALEAARMRLARHLVPP